MNILLTKFISFIDSLNEFVGKSVSWLTGILVLLICYDVVFRYLLNNTQVWIMEMEWHLFALIFLLGAGYTLKHNRHVRVDLFYAKMSAKDKAWIDLLGSVLFLMPWCLLIAYFSFFYALDAYQLGETSPDPGGLPARWIVKFAIFVGTLLLFLQALAEAGRALLVIRRQKE